MSIAKYLGRIHHGFTPDWIERHLEENTIHLTLTSPPIYDEGLYILDDGSAEFRWKDYEEYIEHLRSTLASLHRITVPGGYLVIDTSSGPHEVNSAVEYLYPIPAEITLSAIEMDWIFIGEVIWHKDRVMYFTKNYPPPNVTVRQKHDQLLIFKKKGKREKCGKKIEIASVWEFPYKESDEKLGRYNRVYASFPSALIERILELWTCSGDIVLDPYAGSGQVVRVAEKMGRRGIGVESDIRWKDLWTDLNDK